MRFIIWIVIAFIGLNLIEAKNSCPGKRFKRKSFEYLARDFGFTVNVYDVLTEDNYYLKLFHIPGKKPPVLLMHGIVDSADTFIIRGNGSLAINLANDGYDVWIGNSRGNRYSRRSLYLNPDLDEEFWDYSFHEIGMYDLPAIIDFVLLKSGRPKLSAIGHSQGNTIFYVLGSMRPEYNDKIDILIALSPVCFLNNLNNAVSALTAVFPLFNNLLLVTGQEEVFGDNSPTRVMYEEICRCKRSYDICARGIFFPIAGSDPEEIGPDFFPTVVGYFPTGTSRKNALHTAQVSLRKTFSQYDYGPLNVDLYNSTDPPEYDLTRVTMRIALFVGKNDGLSSVKDVKTLKDSLSSVTEFVIVRHDKFTHLDAVWGKHMHKYLFPHIFRILEKYAT